MKTVAFNSIQCTKFLLRYGSDVSISNKVKYLISQAGKTVKDLAITTKNYELIMLISVYEETFCKIYSL